MKSSIDIGIRTPRALLSIAAIVAGLGCGERATPATGPSSGPPPDAAAIAIATSDAGAKTQNPAPDAAAAAPTAAAPTGPLRARTLVVTPSSLWYLSPSGKLYGRGVNRLFDPTGKSPRPVVFDAWTEVPGLGAVAAFDAGQLGEGVCAYQPGGQVAPAAKSLACHACVVRVDGSVACWGHSFGNSLGNRDAATSRVSGLVEVGVAGATGVRVAPFQTFASTAGELFYWGIRNETYTVTNPHRRLLPAKGAPTPSGWSTLSPGPSSACWVGAPGEAWCVGLVPGRDHAYGPGLEQPPGETYERVDPYRLRALDGSVEVAVGAAHACGRMGDGTVRCVGRGRSGEMGNGKAVDALAPVTVPNLRDVASLVAVGSSTCALAQSGEALCWGDLVGEGRPRLAPAPVALPITAKVLIGVPPASPRTAANYCVVDAASKLTCLAKVGGSATFEGPWPM